MKLVYEARKHERAICALVGVELDEKIVQFNQQELSVLQQAQEICAKASELYQTTIDKIEDQQNDFGWAEIYLNNIIKEG